MKEVDDDATYVYYESNWFADVRRNNDGLMWRYWAAKEMANNVYNSVHNTEEYFGWQPRVFSYLVQILKKEWFR